MHSFFSAELGVKRSGWLPYSFGFRESMYSPFPPYNGGEGEEDEEDEEGEEDE